MTKTGADCMIRPSIATFDGLHAATPEASPLAHLPRLHLVHGPTPIERVSALDTDLGIELWVKRDDATSGAESGNKLRKLEWLLADARRRGSRVIVTCGALQSNHVRATALACARLGFECIALVRVADPHEAEQGRIALEGNALISKLAGCTFRFLSADQYRDRSSHLAEVRAECERHGKPATIIGEGGSSGLGALGYVEAMREVRTQMDLGVGAVPDSRFDIVAVACGSGGTAAGVALGVAHTHVAQTVWALCVCNDASYFRDAVDRMRSEAAAFAPRLRAPESLEMPCVVSGSGYTREACQVVIDDNAKGPGYERISEEQANFIVQVARKTGLVLDPVYTGKALFGLAKAVDRGEIARGSRVLFIHTGGLPGLLAHARDVARYVHDST